MIKVGPKTYCFFSTSTKPCSLKRFFLGTTAEDEFEYRAIYSLYQG